MTTNYAELAERAHDEAEAIEREGAPGWCSRAALMNELGNALEALTAVPQDEPAEDAPTREEVDSLYRELHRTIGTPTTIDVIYGTLDALRDIALRAIREKEMAERDAHAAEPKQEAAGAALSSPVPIAYFDERYEFVHHIDGCPSIDGNGDKDCRCGAVAFLESITAIGAQAPQPSAGATQGPALSPLSRALGLPGFIQPTPPPKPPEPQLRIMKESHIPRKDEA